MECSSGLCPHLSLKPGHRAQGWSAYQDPSSQQGKARQSWYNIAQLWSQHPRFGEVLKKLRLQKRGTGGVDTAAQGSTYDISNIDRLGKSEVGPCNNSAMMAPALCQSG